MKKFNWQDVTIQQFDEIRAISDMKIEDLDKVIHILSVMTGFDYEDYLNCSITTIEQEIKRVDFITNEKPMPRFDGSGKYTIDNVVYNLTLSAQHMTAGQFIDYNNTIATNPNDIAMLCAIVLIPKGKKYGEDYDVLELKETIYQHFKMVDALGISFFFTKLYEALYKCSLQCSIKKLKKEMKKEKDPKKKQAIETSIQAVISHMSGNESTNKLFNIPDSTNTKSSR